MRLFVFFIAYGMFAQNAPPSASELLTLAIASHKAQNERGWKYTFREDHEDVQMDKDGKAGATSKKTYEHIMLEGSDYQKLVLVDGKPLDAKAQKKVDEDLEKARNERRKHGLLTLRRSVSLGDLELYERLFDNRVTREETVLGRKTWRMESELKTGYKPANKQEEEALASRRVTWFDEQDGFDIQTRNVFVRASNAWQPGSTIELQYAKVGEEWLPSLAIIHADLKMMAIVHGRVYTTERYYDYKRFVVDSTVKPE